MKNNNKMKPTKKQKETLKKHQDNFDFICPNCKSESNKHQTEIENPGEEKTQVYCNYGCGYIFLEDYKAKGEY